MNFVLSQEELAAVERLREDIRKSTGLHVALGGIAKAALLGFGRVREARDIVGQLADAALTSAQQFPQISYVFDDLARIGKLLGP